MKIKSLIKPENVFLDLTAADAESGMASVAERLAPGLNLDPAGVVAGLMERERLGSTSIGDRFAIPHCKISGINHIAIALARFREDIPFGVDDGQDVAMAFVVLSPPDQPAAHLQTLSQIARVLKRKELRADLLAATSADEVVEAIRKTAESEGH